MTKKKFRYDLSIYEVNQLSSLKSIKFWRYIKMNYFSYESMAAGRLTPNRGTPSTYTIVKDVSPFFWRRSSSALRRVIWWRWYGVKSVLIHTELHNVWDVRKVFLRSAVNTVCRFCTCTRRGEFHRLLIQFALTISPASPKISKISLAKSMAKPIFGTWYKITLHAFWRRSSSSFSISAQEIRLRARLIWEESAGQR